MYASWRQSTTQLWLSWIGACVADLSTGEDSWPASSCAAYSFLSLTVTHFIGQLKRKTYAGAGDFRPGSNGSISSLTTRWVPLPQPVGPKWTPLFRYREARLDSCWVAWWLAWFQRNVTMTFGSDAANLNEAWLMDHLLSFRHIHRGSFARKT